LALRSRFAILAARFLAFSALRCLAWIFLRRESDIVGMDVSPLGACESDRLNTRGGARHASGRAAGSLGTPVDAQRLAV
jgi:hypothetical protein